jgi:hypothetical protein
MRIMFTCWCCAKNPVSCSWFWNWYTVYSVQ